MANAQILQGLSVAATTANSTTWVDVASIAANQFTANKKYLIIANQVCIHDNVSNHTRVRLVRGTTPTEFADAFCVWEGQGGGASTQSHEISYLYVYTQPGTTELIKLQIAVNTTGSTVTNHLSQIIAINLDDIGTDGTDYFFAEDLNDYTITATPTAKATTASFTPNGTDRWLYIGNMIEDVVSITDEIGFELYDSVAGVLGLCWQEAEDTADQRSHNLFWAGVPTNAARTLSIRPVNEGGSNVMLSGRTIAINLSKFAQSASFFNAAEVDPVSGLWTNMATIAPTPTATGNWVVIAFATVDSDYQNESLKSRLQINADGGGLVSDPAYNDAAPGDDAWDSLDENPFSVFNLVSLTSGASRTINYDWWKVGSTSVIRVEDRGLVAFSVALAASGQSATANQALETDTAQAVAKLKLKAVAQNLETDLAQAITRVKRYAVAQITETNTAQALTWKITRLVAQITETDLSQAVTGRKQKSVAQISETDETQTLTRRKTLVIGQNLETDLAQILAGRKQKTVAQIFETDLAQILAGRKQKAVAQVTETDLAQAITLAAQGIIHQAQESDLAQPIKWQIIRLMNQIIETDLAQVIAGKKQKAVAQNSETDLAQGVTRQKSLVIGQAQESDLAQALFGRKVRVLGQVAEIDLAQIILVLGAVTRIIHVNAIARTSIGANAIARMENVSINSTAITSIAVNAEDVP